MCTRDTDGLHVQHNFCLHLNTASTICSSEYASAQDAARAKRFLKGCNKRIARLKVQLRVKGIFLDRIEDAISAQRALFGGWRCASLRRCTREREQNPQQLRKLKVDDARKELMRNVEQRLR